MLFLDDPQAQRLRTCRQVRKSSGAEASSSRLHTCCKLLSSTCRCMTAYTSGGRPIVSAAAARPSSGDWMRPSSPPVTEPLRSAVRRRAPLDLGPKEASSGSASRQYRPG